MTGPVHIARILCPVDRSEISRTALEHARILARWYRVPLSVLEVVWPGIPPVAVLTSASAEAAWALLTPGERLEGTHALDLFCGAVPDGVDERHEIAAGPIVPVILQQLGDDASALLVMGTHGRGGFDRLVLGSIAEKLMRKAPCPVLTVPPQAADAAVAPALPYRTILCAVDFSPASAKALAYATSLAQEAQARLVLAHVLQWPSEQQMVSDFSLMSCAFAETLKRAAEDRLRAAVPAAARTWCRTVEIVPIGTPHVEIVKLVAAEHADLVVMGVHSRAALAAPFFGSTANQVVRRAPCPVLVVRP